MTDKDDSIARAQRESLDKMQGGGLGSGLFASIVSAIPKPLTKKEGQEVLRIERELAIDTAEYNLITKILDGSESCPIRIMKNMIKLKRKITGLQFDLGVLRGVK